MWASKPVVQPEHYVVFVNRRGAAGPGNETIHVAHAQGHRIVLQTHHRADPVLIEEIGACIFASIREDFQSSLEKEARHLFRRDPVRSGRLRSPAQDPRPPLDHFPLAHVLSDAILEAKAMRQAPTVVERERHEHLNPGSVLISFEAVVARIGP